jgi:hypothetical protein
MLALPFVVVISVMILVLLRPQAANVLILWRIPPESRPPASRLVLVAMIIIFVFGTLGFHAMLPSWQYGRVHLSDLIQTNLAAAAGIAFFLFGSFACLRPIQFIRMSAPRLRETNAKSLDRHSTAIIELVSRAFGIVFLLTASFLLASLGLKG